MLWGDILMKKVFLCAILCCIFFVGCGNSGVSQEEYDNIVAERDELQERVAYLESELNNQGIVETKNASQELREQPIEHQTDSGSSDNNESGVEILSEYTLSDGIGWYTRHFMIIRNNARETVDVSTSSLAYSKDGAIIGAGDSKFYALGAGCTSVIYEAFETGTKISRYETELKSHPSKHYESAIQDLEYVQNDIEDGAVFQVTNNGEKVAEFVEGYALFFLNDELVEYESAYFTDDDSELKPGETISKQLKSYEDFDRIEFYLTGRR